jgi:hypothetical protein
MELPVLGQFLFAGRKPLIEPHDGGEGMDMDRMHQRFALIAAVKQASNMLQEQKAAGHGQCQERSWPRLARP